MSGSSVGRDSSDVCQLPLDRDRFFTAREAKDYGLIDGVLEGRDVTLAPVGFSD